MKPKLFFGTNLKFDLTLNQQLASLSSLKFYDVGLKEYVYIFPADALDRVITLVGKEFDFDEQKAELINIIQHAPGLKEEIELGQWKGEGYVQVQAFPKLFIVSTVIRKKPQNFKIPVETVEAAWKAVKTLKRGECRKSKDLAEKWCNVLGITRFHRQTGSWDGDKLYGCREDYFKWYFSLKVLEHYGLIDYSKSGVVSRIKDSWEFQGNII